MKCFITTYELEETRIEFNKNSMKVNLIKKPLFRNINIIWDKDLYIIDCGNNENVYYKNKINDLLQSYNHKRINESTLRSLESELMNIINMAIGQNVTMPDSDIFRPKEPYIKIGKNKYYKNYVAMGRF